MTNESCGNHDDIHSTAAAVVSTSSSSSKLTSLTEAVESLAMERADPAKDMPRKTVRFAPVESQVVCCVPTRASLGEEEVQETWWSSTEYQGIRLGAKFLTRDVRKRDKHLIKGIEEAYARALHLACTLSDEDYEHLMLECANQVGCMWGWCDRNLSARGLERYTSQKHRFERAEFAEETRAAVLRLSANASVTIEQLAVFYKEYARSAAIYARFCGEADYSVSYACQSLTGKSTIPSSSTTTTTTTAATKSIIPTAKLSNSIASSTEASSPTAATTDLCHTTELSHQSGHESRDTMRISKEPSQGRLMVRRLSQRVETAFS